MPLRLEFADIEGARGDDFTLAADTDQYPLPHLVLTADRQVWVRDAKISSCQLTPDDEFLRELLLAAWGNRIPDGHGVQLSSPQCWLPAAAVRDVTTVQVTWEVTWFDTSPYERSQNTVEPFFAQSSVTLRFDLPGEQEEAPTVPAAGHHRGHVAVDFGTSNCTAALFDLQYLPPARPLSPRQVGKLRSSVLDVLDRVPAAGAAAQDELGDFIADIAAAILTETTGLTDDELRADLRMALAEDSDREPRLLYALLLELERCVCQCSEELRPPLAAALNDAYNQSWGIPPLDQLRLFDVQLDVNEGQVIESKATATLDPRLSVRLGKLELGDEGGQENLVYAGLKQRLSAVEQHPELWTGATSDDLIRESLRDIVRRCNVYIGQGPADFGKGQVNNVVITFPTMATPAVRQKLGDMVRATGVSLVDSTFDEAVAAAMFVLLQDFGGDYDTGLELLRSRSRPVGPTQWKQNLLIIDIGGGTTDIALLGLHLQDETPSGLGDPGRHGRYYVLRPEVLGSTGRLQLGGELLSLRVFTWIKALIGDQLLRLFPGTFERSLGALRQIVRGNLSDNPFRNMTRADSQPVGGDVLDVLDSVVPTRTKTGSSRLSQAFWLLWTIADDTKLTFCRPDAPEEITLRPAEIRRVLQVAEWPEAMASVPDLQSISDENLEITLTRRDFEKLVTDDIDQMMHLAYRLVGERLAGMEQAGDEPAQTAEQIDRIVLTGQASQAPLVRNRLMAVFSGPGPDGMAVPWHPSAVSAVSGEYAKLATSLGACWAKSCQDLVPKPKGAIGGLIKGRNAFRIVVDNLFFNLPCSFCIAPQLGGKDSAEEILHIGDEMYQAYPDQDFAVIRSEPFELTNTVAIFRDGQGDRPRWGDFQWQVMEQKLRWQVVEQKLGPRLDRSIWPSGITARLEATSSLDLYLLLWRGPAHYRVGGEAISVLGGAAAAGAARANGADHGMTQGPGFDPSRIVVNAFWGDGSHEGAAIFDDGADDRKGGRPAMPFPETFHVPGPGNGESELRGAISVRLPDPPAGGSWNFHYLDEQNGMYLIGELWPPPRRGQLEIRYFATVDERGELRVHAGQVPYWPADSLADVEARPGSVCRVQMESTYRDYDPDRDPYNGQH